MAYQHKDNFSAQSAAYAAFRPHYPQALYDFLFALPVVIQTAWDCGTGNGQVASVLAEKYKHVYATDISEAQLQKATIKPNITYTKAGAEASGLADQSINLITVAQAVHWFDFDAFHKEVKRVAKPGAFITIWGYGLLSISHEIDTIITYFYKHTTGPYWDSERRHLDVAYNTIPFPYKEVSCPGFEIKATWTREQFMGYLSSWSSVQHYIKQQGTSPLPDLKAQLLEQWPDGKSIEVTFPVFMRIGKV
ncbi:class I SAM-dependent methyltransferase [Pontibacter aydingkolensis]|uniref:Class I SAM-dependent methyltransferase n=2 Tax=Pontibacter aydingkolensis TaxID=1911536 RepID=A0ABS7CU04_9BACT|nr:class I SAM-dependent methyltransferase [Pontibacter aydingkolensis]